MSTAWHRKDLLSLRELSADELNQVLATAKVFKEILGRPIKKVPSLQGRTVVNLFVEPSTRTKISFELAAVRLSADVVSLDKDSSSLRKGETLSDTAKNLEALQAGIIVIRHRSAGAAHFLSSRLKASVINAGDGAHEHPTQGLLDTFTILERLGKLDGVRVLIVGDIIHSRVARSNLWALTKLGAKVTLVGPPTLLPREFEELGVKVSYNLDEELEQADVINLLRIQHERQRAGYFPGTGEYAALFGLNAARAERLKPGALVMHPGPINRGVELDGAVADGPQSVILDQVTNGLAVRMAVLFLCGSVPPPENS
jgi:aspartate carbamoyltransferase catalytic subunit